MRKTIKALMIAAGVATFAQSSQAATQAYTAGICASVNDQIAMRASDGRIKDREVLAMAQSKSSKLFQKYQGQSDFTQGYNTARGQVAGIANTNLFNMGADCGKRGF